MLLAQPDSRYHGWLDQWVAPLMLAALVTLMVLDRLGIRVDGGNAAMPGATAAATMAAALAGGAILGVIFSRYARTGSSKHRAG